MLHHGYMPPEVDHINGDRADNRIENIRAANRSENQCNRFALANNTSGYPGVSWHKKTWGVDYSKLVPMLIKEIQSLRARVAALEQA